MDSKKKSLILSIFFLSFLYLLIRTTPLFTWVCNLINYRYRDAAYNSLSLFNGIILAGFVLLNVFVYIYRKIIYRKIIKQINFSRLAIFTFVLGTLLFFFFKEDILQVRNINTGNSSWVYNKKAGEWQNEKKLYPVDDEECYIMLAEVIKTEGLKNYFDYLEMDKYSPKSIKAQIARAQSVHPPLYYIWLSFFPSFFLMRYANFIIFWICSLLIYGILKKLISEKIALSGMLLFFFAPYLFTFEAMKCHNDIFVTLWVLASLYFLIKNTKSKKSIIISGLFLGIALVSKYTAFIIAPVLILYLIIKSIKTNQNYFMNSVLFILPAAIIFSIWVLKASGTWIGLFQWRRYLGDLFLSKLGIDTIQTVKGSGGGSWKSPLTMAAEAVNTFGPGLVLLFGLSIFNLKNVVDLKNFEELFFIILFITMIIGVYFVNPLLRYAMPVNFVIIYFALKNMNSIFRNNVIKMDIIFILLSMDMAKILIKLVEGI